MKKAEAEAASIGDGGTASPAPALCKITVIVFSKQDEEAINSALAKWSPTTKALGGSKTLRSVSATAPPRHVGPLLHKLAAALDQSQPSKLNVRIEL